MLNSNNTVKQQEQTISLEQLELRSRWIADELVGKITLLCKINAALAEENKQLKRQISDRNNETEKE